MLKFLKISFVISLILLGVNTYGANVDFAIIKAETISPKKINLTFNSALESSSSAVRDFKIVNKGNDLDIIEIKTNKLISTDKLEIELSKDLEVSTEYEINVVSIKDNKGNSITKGINGIVAFKTPSKFEVEAIETKVDNTTEETKPIVEEIKPITEEKKDEILMSSASKEEYSTGVSNTIVAESKNTDNLPKTGPEEILLLLGSLILGFFVFKKKKV